MAEKHRNCTHHTTATAIAAAMLEMGMEMEAETGTARDQEAAMYYGSSSAPTGPRTTVWTKLPGRAE